MTDDDPRLRAIERALGTPLPSARVAEVRVWAALRSARPDRVGLRQPVPRRAALANFALGLGAVLALAVGLAWSQNVRVGVGGNALPVLYRSEVARTDFASDGASGSIAIGERFLREPSQLSAVADVVVRIEQGALPADVEVRFAETGDSSYGILAQTRGVVGSSRPPLGGAVTVTYAAPLPPSDRRATHSYRVWVHIDERDRVVESGTLAVEVTGTPEGQRVRESAGP